MRSLLLIIICLLHSYLNAQPYKVLHYSETSGFDHQTRSNSFSLFNSFQGLQLTHDLDGSEFNSLNNLLSYDLIIFSNTSGSQLLDSSQRNHFEQYIQNGGHLMGIHAATDTYRHSTANGSPTGLWDFYAETLGGSVQQGPNHVAGTPLYQMNHLQIHQSLYGIPNPWTKNEEYYYWENGYLDSSIVVILEVEETVGPNNQVNSYDSARAVSWYKNLSSGSRIFYTSLGHANSYYTSDTLFQRHLEKAMNWCLGRSTQIIEEQKENSLFKIFPNPAKELFNIQLPESNGSIAIYNLEGRLLYKKNVQKNDNSIDISQFSNGIYLLNYKSEQKQINKKFIVKQ